MTTDLPIGDLDNWRQVFTEPFDNDVPVGQFPAAVSSRWRAYPSPWKDTSGIGTYSPKLVVSIADGILTKRLRTLGGVHLVAAIAPSVPGSDKFGQLYGRYAVRWRADNLDGYKVAWLLWPDSNDRDDGEIDLPEMDLHSVQVGGFVHRVDGGGQAWVFAAIDATQWHTSVIEWSPGLVVLIHDGVEILRTDIGVPDTAMHWVIQTETQLDDSNPDAEVEGVVQLAWVAAWQWDPTAKAPPKPRQMTLVAAATVAGITTLAAEASADVREVKWVVDGLEVGYDNIRPFSRPWDTTRFENGVHTIYAKGRDQFKWFDGPRRTINVRNPWHLLAPQTATGVVTLGVTPYSWLQGVKWVLDGIEIGSDLAAPFSMQWDSRKVPNGVHSIYVKIRDSVKWYDGPPEPISVDN